MQQLPGRHPALMFDTFHRHLDPMYRCALIAQEVLLLKPHIVCLQEVEQELFDGILSRKLAAGGFQGFFVPMTRGCSVGAATYFNTAAFTASLVVPVALSHLVRGFRSQFSRQVGQLLGAENVALANHPPCAEYPMLVGFSDGTYNKTCSGSVLPCAAVNSGARQRKRDAELASVLSSHAAQGVGAQATYDASQLLPQATKNAHAVQRLREMEGQFKKLKVADDVVAHVPAVFPKLHLPAEPAAVNAAQRGLSPGGAQRVTKAVGGLPDCLSKIHTLGQVALVLVLQPAGSDGPPIVVTNYHAFWDPRWSDIKAVHTWLLLQWLQQLDVLLYSGEALPWDWVGPTDALQGGGLPDAAASAAPSEETKNAPAASAAGGSSSAAEPTSSSRLAHFLLGDFNSNPLLQTSDLVKVPEEAVGTVPGLLQLLSDAGPLPFAVPPSHFSHPSYRTGGFEATLAVRKDWPLDAKSLVLAKALPNAMQALLSNPLCTPWQWRNAYVDVWGKNVEWSNWTPTFRGMLDYIFMSRGASRAVAVLTDEVRMPDGSRSSMSQVLKGEGFRGCPNRLTGSDHVPVAADVALS